LPESWAIPDEAEVVGQVVGIVTRFNEPGSFPQPVSPAERAYSSKKAL